MILNKRMNRDCDESRQMLFLVVVNGLQLLTNGENAEQAIVNAKVWAELEGRETFKRNFFKTTGAGCCECDEDDECECEKKNKRTVTPRPIVITDVTHGGDRVNLSFLDAIYISDPPKKAKRKYTKHAA